MGTLRSKKQIICLVLITGPVFDLKLSLHWAKPNKRLLGLPSRGDSWSSEPIF